MPLPLPFPVFRAFDHSTGAPLAGGKLFSFYAGTSTPLGTFTDGTLTVPNANPTILDANGEAQIFPNPNLLYKYILQNAAGVVQWTVDNHSISSTAGSGASTNAGKNLITEPDFDGWQEKQSYAGAANLVVSDAWAARITTGVPGNFTISRQGSGLPGSGWCLRFARNAGATDLGGVTVCQNIEPIISQLTQGQYLTLSFYMRAGANFSGTGIPSVSIRTGTSTYEQWQAAGVFGGEQVVGQANKTLTTSFQQFFIVASVLSPYNTSEIAVTFGDGYNFAGTAGAADYFELAKVQLEVGTTASAFEMLMDQESFARRQRRYWKTFPVGVNPANNAGVTGAISFPQVVGAGVAGQVALLPLPVVMMNRGVNPTVTSYNPSAANFQARNVTVGADCAATVTTGDIANLIKASYTTAAGSAAGNENRVHITVDKRY